MQAFVFSLLLNAITLGQAPGPVDGTVLDGSGAPVPNATVRIGVSGRTIDESLTASDGRFEFKTDVSGDIRIVVTAAGFAQAVVTVPDANRSGLQVAPQPAPFFEAVNVTSSRADVPRADPTATVMVFSATELLTSAPVSLDDALK